MDFHVGHYVDDHNVTVDERHERVKDIFEREAEQAIELNDGFVTPPRATASLRIAAAEALVPVPAASPPPDHL